MHTSTVLLVTLVVYLVMLLGIGVYFGKKNKNANDYLVAGRSLPTWVAILTLTATMFGGGAIVGRAQFGYNNGLIAFGYCLTPIIGQTLLSFLITRMRKFSEYTTVTEFLEDRYQSAFIRTACAFLSMIALIGITATQVAAIANILNAMGFTNTRLTAVVCMAVIILLTVVGGILAVSYTDSIQIGIVIVGVGMLLAAVLNGYGGLASLMDKVQALPALPGDYMVVGSSKKIWWLLWLWVPGVMYTLIGQDGYQRLFACKNLKASKLTARCAGIMICLLSVPAVIFGMAGRVEFPELAANGATATVIARVCLNYLPGVFAAVFLCAVLSAILSTADSLLSAATSHFISDFWVRFVDKNADFQGRKLLMVSRIFTLVAGALALFLSFGMGEIMTFMNYCYTIYTAGAFVPIIMGALWKKANKYGASAGLVAGCAMAIVGISGFKIGNMPGELLSAVLAAVVTVVVSLATASKTASVVGE